MGSKCANPACSAPFLYLHEGRIFVLRSPRLADSDVTDAVLERYWLCGLCSETMTLVQQEGKVVLRNIQASVPALRRVSPSPRLRQSAA